MAIAYVVVAFGIFEGTDLLASSLGLPGWTTTLVVVLGIAAFPIALILAWAYEASPSGIRRDDGSDNRPNTREPVTVGAQSRDGAPVAAPTGADVATPPRSLAVLPLLNLSRDPENQYFGDGLAEEILNLLAGLPQLRVASRTSSFSFRGKDLDLRQIADRLGVEAMLEGSVRRSGNRVRISAQLVDARTDDHLWAEAYDREIGDVFALQEEIARDIVGALRLRLRPRDRRSLQKDPTTGSIRAYDFYLRGRQFFFQVDRGGMEFARETFLKAIDIDPEYALAWAGVAQCAAWLATWVDDTPERRAEADTASRKALELAPDRAETHAARGQVLTLEERYDEADAHFERASILDPGLFDAWYLHARARFAQGDLEEAAELFQRAAEVRPDDVQSRALHSQTLKALGRDDEARAVAREAVEVAERHLELHPDDSRALTLGAGAWIDVGDMEKAMEWVERALELSPDDVGVLHNAACAFAHVGDVDRALDLLERRVRVGPTMDRAWIAHDPDFDRLRDHPRFTALLDETP
ncbi:MAG: TPR end-of-group domain-containing protein [Longimicrobiales bacterium]